MKLGKEETVVNCIKSFRDIKKQDGYIFSAIQGLIPLIGTVQEKRLGRVTRTKARLMGEQKIV